MSGRTAPPAMSTSAAAEHGEPITTKREARLDKSAAGLLLLCRHDDHRQCHAQRIDETVEPILDRGTEGKVLLAFAAMDGVGTRIDMVLTCCTNET